MGVDVFGRNTYGGGEMRCDVALTAARSAGRPSASSYKETKKCLAQLLAWLYLSREPINAVIPEQDCLSIGSA